MPAFALLAPGTRAAARLADALKDHHSLVRVSNWASLHVTMASQPVDGAILDPFDPHGRLRLSELEELRAEHPSVALILFGEFQGRGPDLMELGRLGIDGIVEDQGPAGPRDIRERIESALDVALSTRLQRTLGGKLGPLALACLSHAVRQARLSARSDDLAAALGTSARSLAGRLRVGGLPPLRRFLLWGRLIEAAYLLSWERSTVEDTAFRVRYATGAALQGAFRRTLGASPLDVVERGGWRFVAEAAVTELRRSQTAHPPDPGTVQ